MIALVIQCQSWQLIDLRETSMTCVYRNYYNYDVSVDSTWCSKMGALLMLK